jgi:hypothetical protein
MIYYYAFDCMKMHVPSNPWTAPKEQLRVSFQEPILKEKLPLVQDTVDHPQELGSTPSHIHGSLNVLRLSHQAYIETGGLFHNKCTAYIPIYANLELSTLHRLIANGKQSMLHPHEATIVTALADIRDLHLHLHVQHLNPTTENTLLWKLLEVMRNVSLNATPRVRAKKWGGRKRKIMVHLDHYVADDWEDSIKQTRCTLHNIFAHMGRENKKAEADCEWIVAYYVDIGDKDASNDPHEGVLRYISQTNALYGYVTGRNQNVRINSELKENKLFADGSEATPRSSVWPAYSEDISGPDRREEREKLKAKSMGWSV